MEDGTTNERGGIGPALCRSDELTLQSVVTARADLVSRRYDALTLVVGTRAVTLNDSSLEVLHALDGERTLRDVAELVALRHHLVPGSLEPVMVPLAVGFARAELLVGVAFVPPADAAEPADPSSVEPAVDERGVPIEADGVVSCRGKLLRLGDAEFIDVEGANGRAGALSISCNEPALAAALRERFAPALGAPARHGLAVVVGRSDLARGPLVEIFDASGYRIWRGRSHEAALGALASLLTPILPDPRVHRALMCLRRLVRGGQAILIDPPVIESIRVQRAIERAGWSIPPAVWSEVDLDTAELVIRAPFDPADPSRNDVVERLPVVGLGLPLQLQAGHGLGPVIEGLCNAVLSTQVSASAREALDAMDRLAASTVARWPLMPGTDQQLPFVEALLTAVDLDLRRSA